MPWHYTISDYDIFIFICKFLCSILLLKTRGVDAGISVVNWTEAWRWPQEFSIGLQPIENSNGLANWLGIPDMYPNFLVQCLKWAFSLYGTLCHLKILHLIPIRLPDKIICMDGFSCISDNIYCIKTDKKVNKTLKTFLTFDIIIVGVPETATAPCLTAWPPPCSSSPPAPPPYYSFDH